MKRCLAAVRVLCAIVGATPAFATGVTINGTCVAGACGSPDIIAGGSASFSFNVVLTMANGDQYRVDGSADAAGGSAPGAAKGTPDTDSVVAPFSITYIGNPAATMPKGVAPGNAQVLVNVGGISSGAVTLAVH